MTHLEFSVLLYLAQQPGRVFSQQQIFEAVWNEDSDTCRHAVVNIIHQLRKKIEPDPAHPIYIQTVIHTGYKFLLPKSEFREDIL
ncbi:MAG: helix-turn-helix domain-containing protein [Lachnospiraceae bacterium]